MRALDIAASVPWAIRPEALNALLAIAAREDVAPALIAAAMSHAPEAVAAKLGRPLDNSHTVSVRDDVAVVPVVGPIFRYGGLFSAISGATSIEVVARDFQTALDDPDVRAILLHVDSPGGEVSGVGEFADMIYAARGRKPITAYVSDLGASAAYWIASATDRVVVAETAAVGSIGVVAAMKDPAKHDTREIEFVSSQSPKKRADITTEGGRAQVQAVVDAIADVFVGTVARNRGVSVETVLRRYGAGGILIGRQAVEAGLADQLGSFEGTLRDLQVTVGSRSRQTASRLSAPAATGYALATAASPVARSITLDRQERMMPSPMIRTADPDTVWETIESRATAAARPGESLPAAIDRFLMTTDGAELHEQYRLAHLGRLRRTTGYERFGGTE